MIKQTEYAKRRKQVMQSIGATGILILPAARHVLRSGDSHFPYRQQNDFYYLTGFDEPEAVLVIAPKRKEGEFILFNRPKNREQEIWEGVRAGQSGACKQFGADQSFSIHDLEKHLPELLTGRQEIHYTMGVDKHFDAILLNALNMIRGKIRNGTQYPLSFVDSAETLHEMRLIKSPAEIDLMRKAAEITAHGHMRAMEACKPGMNEYELEAELSYEFQKRGARFTAYSSIVGAGANSCVLHYTSNNEPVKNNTLVLIDAGAEYYNYAADVTRTFPANGKFTPEQRAIYDIVLEAQLAGIKAIKPGAPWPNIQTAIVKVITEGLVDVGLLKGRVSELIEKQAYLPFYMHRSGHWLGLDVHDVGRYKINGKWRNLQANMVLTVEPGIYISADLKNVPKRWHNIGVRIEDDVLVTTKGYEILSHQVPKKAEEVEMLVGSAY